MSAGLVSPLVAEPAASCPPPYLTLDQARAAADHLLSPSAQGAPVDDALLLKIERFLRMEARLLDEEKFRAWYNLLAEDLFYWAPVRESRYRRDKRPEITYAGMTFFDDRKADIDTRLKRLETGMAWSEDPPTRHVYAITNVEAFETGVSGEYEVHSIFTQYRHRADYDASTLMGRRRDILRADGSSFLIAKRLILLQQSVLMAKNISVFF
jgi:ethylbenzene dioxygenase beta subunit